MAERIWSAQQNDIFEWFADGSGNLVVRARAGTGKSTTILEAIKRAPENPILLAAFNTKIAKHLQKSVTPGGRVQVKTLHSLGYSIVRSNQNWGYIKVDDKDVLLKRADCLSEEAIKSYGIEVAPFYMTKLVRLVSKVHSLGREILPYSKSTGDLIELIDRFECEPDEDMERQGCTVDMIEALALEAMELAAKERPVKTGIDFADMLYLPVRNRWSQPEYPLGVVDEAQDMTTTQLDLFLSVCGGRICVVGDNRQAIYRFRGADSDSLDRLKVKLKAKELGLNTTYRCGKLIVAHAARIVPDFRAHEGNHDGSITYGDTLEQLVAQAQEGDFVLSRKNAPLAGVAMAMIRAKKRVQVAGKDIGKGLETVANKLAKGGAGQSIPLFLAKLRAWEEKECARAVKGAKSQQQAESKVEAIHDKADTLQFLTEGAASVNEVIALIVRLFADMDGDRAPDPSTFTTCSSIHKAKGLEADRVFVLTNTLYPRFKGMTPEQHMEECNLEYVAVTRAKHELVLMNLDEDAPPVPRLTVVGESREWAGEETAVAVAAPTRKPRGRKGKPTPVVPMAEGDIDTGVERVIDLLNGQHSFAPDERGDYCTLCGASETDHQMANALGLAGEPR